MSCETGANAITRLACRISGGISQLAGKRGFYAGLALGGAGLLGGGLVALARRQSTAAASLRQAPLLPAIDSGSAGTIPQLPGRQSVSPLSRAPLGERCGRCDAGGNKPGLWYRIGGKTYCQDCAPGTAQQADVDLTVPKPDIPDKQITRRGAKNAIAGDGGDSKGDKPLSAEKRVETRLEPSRLRVLVPPEQTGGRPVPAVTNSGYVVLRANVRDGREETGLAITPVMEVNNNGEVTEDINRWGVVHVATGAMLAFPYAGPQVAEILAGIMAQHDWTVPVEEMKKAQLDQMRQTINKFNAAVDAAQGQPGKNTALDGRLVTAAMYGGVSRVIQDNGSTLLLMDQMGGRHEVRRDEIRLPRPGDYESSRVAMAIDPASEPETTCPDCGISSRQTVGEMWYKAGWKARCASCTKSFAMNQGYFLEEEVGEEAYV